MRLRAKILERLREAVANAELQPGVDLHGLAELIETTYHGAMICWAIHRDGPLVRSLEAAFTRLLQPYRT